MHHDLWRHRWAQGGGHSVSFQKITRFLVCRAAATISTLPSPLRSAALMSSTAMSPAESDGLAASGASASTA